jgi:beta-glucosidase
MLGSLLSGGGSTPTPNTPEAWADVDPVHGPGNVVGATVFPHNIGLGPPATPGWWSGSST